MFKILFLGDVFGRPGREILRDALPRLISERGPDLVIANGENASGGIGLKADTARELFDYGVDVLTGGNHTFKYRNLFDELGDDPRLTRPANYPEPCPGRPYTVLETRAGLKVGVGNLLGRIYLGPGLDCPFRTGMKIAAEMKAAGSRIILIDFHAEATSEKKALGWHLDGKIGALVGTHTHVATNDAQILPQGTAYQSDAGMCGPHNSVIGMQTEAVLAGFLSGRPQRFEPARKGRQLNGTIITLSRRTGLATNIEPLIIKLDRE